MKDIEVSENRLNKPCPYCQKTDCCLVLAGIEAESKLARMRELLKDDLYVFKYILNLREPSALSFGMKFAESCNQSIEAIEQILAEDSPKSVEEER